MNRRYSTETLNALRSEQVFATLHGTEVIIRKVPFSKQKGVLDACLFSYKKEQTPSVSAMQIPSLAKELAVVPGDVIAEKLQTVVDLAAKSKPENQLDPEFDVTSEEFVFNLDCGNLRTIKYSCNNFQKPAPCFIHLHGGAWCMGHPVKNDLTLLYLSHHTGALCFDVDYSLSPQSKYPTAVNEICSLVEHLYNNADTYGIDKNKIVVGGGSAGGNLTVATCLKLRDENKNYVAMQVPLVPALLLGADKKPTDYYCTADDYYVPEATLPLIEKMEPLEDSIFLVKTADAYVGNGDRYAPYASPLLAESFRGLPKTLIQTAEFDPLWVQGVTYTKKLREDGIEVKHIHYLGIEHSSNGMLGVIPQAEDLFSEIARAINNL